MPQNERCRMAFAKTLPDSEAVRESSVRIRENNHPLSSDLRRLAEAVESLCNDIAATLRSGSGLQALELLEALPAKQRLLASRLREHARTAESHETELIEKMRQLREILEACHD